MGIPYLPGTGRREKSERNFSAVGGPATGDPNRLGIIRQGTGNSEDKEIPVNFVDLVKGKTVVLQDEMHPAYFPESARTIG